MPAPASAPSGIRALPAPRCDGRAVLDVLLLVCAAVAIVATVVRISLEPAVAVSRPRRITWDDPADVER
jgi:hypothetical protein